MEETNKPRLYFFIKAPILIIAIIIFIRDINQLLEYYYSIDDPGGIIGCLKIIFTTTILRSSLILLIPFIGIFLDNKIGWSLILSTYFFWIILFIYAIFTSSIDREGSIVIISGIFIVLLVCIGLMNSRENCTLVYGIDKSEKLKMNFLSLLIALIGISIIVVLNLN
ncbi:hypothetical protein [Mangrovimonas futianensis]|uniref:hypothetical protein n=1 Tax=Mangrovimonas futianensis TaxID=2895523 RepID=UPI001E3D905A|nr:hypothetical protein [Mangrovimonas futianensis]MCF1420716.1 hypothetical protein [Mangrovimonas futianensis]